MDSNSHVANECSCKFVNFPYIPNVIWISSKNIQIPFYHLNNVWVRAYFFCCYMIPLLSFSSLFILIICDVQNKLLLENSLYVIIRDVLLVNELYFLSLQLVQIYILYIILFGVATQPCNDLIIGMEWFLLGWNDII